MVLAEDLLYGVTVGRTERQVQHAVLAIACGQFVAQERSSCNLVTASWSSFPLSPSSHCRNHCRSSEEVYIALSPFVVMRNLYAKTILLFAVLTQVGIIQEENRKDCLAA